ncbi:hypothetical protein GCM10023185_09560 [Hymenobacter saemangeumensis]|uniref:TonB C-terminal domain-containing protein n=2 Tax=Hymenobacter saemangeumensis TaxID=1084522 RepID=A0ABP8I4H1_9BACT
MLHAPGPHPDAATLRQYAAGTLASAEQQRVEAHTLDCERCAELLDGFSMTDAPTTDRAITALRDRLRERVGEPAPVAVPARPLWPRVVAAAATVAVLAGGIWTWEQQSVPTEVAAVRPEPEAYTPPSPAASVESPSAAAPAEAAAEVAAAPASPVPAPAVVRAAKPARLARASTPGRASSAPSAPAAEALVLADTAPEPALASSSPVEPAADLAVATNPGTEERTELKEQTADIVAPTLSSAKAKRTASAAPAPAELSGRQAGAMPAAPTIAPAPMGGTVALREYLRRSGLQFEPVANEERLSGRVHVRFTVGEDGRISNVKVTRGLRPDYDAEAQRIVCEGPAWHPGISGGRRAPLTVDVVVPF